MLSSIVKDHCCYGYIKNRPFCSKKILFSEIVWYFIGGVYTINRTSHGRSEETKFIFSCSKIFHSFNLSTLEEKFRITARLFNIFYIIHGLFYLIQTVIFKNESH